MLLDCDLAGNVDGAYAVALLLGSPELEVLDLVMGRGFERSKPASTNVAQSIIDPNWFDLAPIGMVLWRELFTTRPAPVRVNDKGFSELVDGVPPNGEIGVTVNMDELIQRTMDRYLKQNLMRQPKL